ncbi:MAG TPA: HIT domain-containing protein [bacterium]|nr:HIT domain-containing protein [bacterium]
MKQLWAPWRLAYIQQDHPEGCIFCRAVDGNRDRETLVVHRRPRTFVIMNLYPYNSGHVMVVPNRHVGRPADLDDAELLELMQTTVLSHRALEAVFHPEGSNIGMNLGRAAGAGIDDHLHVHVVPRWVGDTNFMPVLGDVKVIPEQLEATYDRLAAAFAELEQAR